MGGSRRAKDGAEETDVVEKNLRMFLNVARCLRPDQRMIHLGSGAEYARGHYQPKMPETYFDSFVPADHYGYSKYAISKQIENMPNVLCLRVFGIYGQYEDYRFKFISNAIVKNLLGMPITIVQNTIYDYLYMPDFVQLVQIIIGRDRWPYRHMNITPEVPVDLLTLARCINEASEFPSEINVLISGWKEPYSGSNQRLLDVVGSFQFTSPSNAIRELAAYYRREIGNLDVETVKADPYLRRSLENGSRNAS